MGRIITSVTIENRDGPSPAPAMRVDALVDTGASHMVLPLAWKEKFGVFSSELEDDVQTASQKMETAAICGPAQVTVDGFRNTQTEVVFLNMRPGADGEYLPLVGYTVLELSKIAVDMVGHRLILGRHFEVRRARAHGKD